MNGDQVMGFSSISHEGFSYFKNNFKEDGIITISEMLKVS